MSWRTVVISNSAKLDYQMGYLIVRNQDVVKIHISEISILMIETTSVSLTAALLCELTKKKIKVIFCDEKRNPSYILKLFIIYLHKSPIVTSRKADLFNKFTTGNSSIKCNIISHFYKSHPIFCIPFP